MGACRQALGVASGRNGPRPTAHTARVWARANRIAKAIVKLEVERAAPLGEGEEEFLQFFGLVGAL